MKLELKHLAPYLPYKIKMLHYDKKKVLNAGQGSSVHWVGITHALNHQENTKPLLHPLSRLTEPIDFNINNISYAAYLKLFSQADLDYVMQSPLLCDFTTVIKLTEWHFDVFGLIDKGLAEPIELTDKD